jgi:hypothetical protein
MSDLDPASGMGHCITVGHLKRLLRKLEDSDLLVPNCVGNLTVARNGKVIGFIDLLDGAQSLELFED